MFKKELVNFKLFIRIKKLKTVSFFILKYFIFVACTDHFLKRQFL